MKAQMKKLRLISAVLLSGIFVAPCSILSASDATTPNVADSKECSAKFELRLVHRSAIPSDANAPVSEWPVGYELMLMERNENGRSIQIPLYVKRRPEAGNGIIESAGVVRTERDDYQIMLKLTKEGGDRMYAITSQIVKEDNLTGSKQKLAIVLNGKIVSAPTVHTTVRGDVAISGNFSREEAVELAGVLGAPKLGSEE